MCTTFVRSLVQNSNAKILSYKQKLKHSNSIGTHLELACQSWFTQKEETKNTNNTTSTVSTMQTTESNVPTDAGYRQQRKDLGKSVRSQQYDSNWWRQERASKTGCKTRRRTRVHTKIHHHCLQLFKSRNQATAMSHHLFQAQRLNGHEQRKWYERNVLSLFVSAATKELILLSIKQKNDK